MSDRVYRNSGNRALLALLDPACVTILDVGCGAGDNARLSRELGFQRKFYGITLSPAEREKASPSMEQCWIADVEESSLEFLKELRFDSIMFSHVLEHVKDPTAVVSKFLPLLKTRGIILVAVPNVLSWRQRLLFLFGRFEYQADGVMDNTHLRFFTYHTAQHCLPAESSSVKIVVKKVDGSVPLWVLRRYLFSSKASRWFDRMGCALFPNLFGTQILIKAEKISDR